MGRVKMVGVVSNALLYIRTMVLIHAIYAAQNEIPSVENGGVQNVPDGIQILFLDVSCVNNLKTVQ